MPKRNGFTPSGNYPKIQLPWSRLQLPWTRPETHGKLDMGKLEETFVAIQDRVDEQSSYLNRTTFDAAQGTRWATIVIAAENSTDRSKETADYVCSSSNAGTVINNAIAVLLAIRTPAASTPVGRIVLLEGTYALGSTPIGTSSLSGRAIHIQGMGGHGRSDTIGETRITATNAAFSFAGSGVGGGSALMLSDLQISAGSNSAAAIALQDIPTFITRCSIIAGGNQGAIVQGATTGGGGGTIISDNYIYCSVSAAVGIQCHVGASPDEPVLIENNLIKVTGSGSGCVLMNQISTIPTYIVRGNTIIGTTSGGTGIGVDYRGNSNENGVVNGNLVRSMNIGYVMGGYRHDVSGNVAEGCGTGFSTGSDSQYLALLGNHASQCTTAFNLANSAIRPTVIGNKASVCTNSCVIASGVTNAYVAYNDFGGVAVSDAGTTTTLEHTIPAGGASGSALRKNSATDYDYSWLAVHDVPAGGSTGQVLTKNSGTDYDASWAAGGGGGGGTAGTLNYGRTRRGGTTSYTRTGATTWAEVDSTNCTVSCAASAGDILFVSLSCIGSITATGNAGLIDFHTKVSGSRVNSVGQAAAVSDSQEGVQAWRLQSSTSPINVGGGVLYTVQSGDISGGTVTFTLVFRTQDSTKTVTIYQAAAGTEIIEMDAVNLSAMVGISGINSLSDVDTSTTAPTLGDTLVWDGTNWIPDTTYHTPDNPKSWFDLWGTSAHASEFDTKSTSLPSGWSWVNQNASTYQEGVGAGVLKLDNSGTDSLKGIFRTYPPHTRVAAKFGLSGPNTAGVVGGLSLRESATGKQFTFYPTQGSGGVWAVDLYTNPTTFSSRPVTVQGWPFGSSYGHYYLMVVRNSSTSYDFYASHDGAAWFQVATGVNPSFTPDQVGIVANSRATSTTQLACYWFRAI